MQPLDPLRFVLIGLAGWLNEHQRDVIDYLGEREPRVARSTGEQAPLRRLEPSPINRGIRMLRMDPRAYQSTLLSSIFSMQTIRRPLSVNCFLRRKVARSDWRKWMLENQKGVGEARTAL